MTIPDELKRMLGRLDYNKEYLVNRPEDLVFIALLRSSQAQRQVVKAFLDELLSSNPSYEDLQEVWWSGPIEIIFKDEAYLRNFFKLLRDRLAASP